MGSRCVTGRLLLVVVRPDRNVDAPVDGGGRSLTDCVARLVSAPILARSWTPSVARVTAPASSILRDPHKKESEGRAVRPRQSGREAVWFAWRKVSKKVLHAATEQRGRTCPPHDTSAELKPSSIPHRIEFYFLILQNCPITVYTLSHSYTTQHGCLSARAGHRAIVKVRVDFSTVAACASLPTLSRSDRALLTPPRSIGVNPIQNHPLRTHTRSLTLPAHRSARSAATPWLVPCLQPRRMPGGGGDLNS